MLRGLLVRVLLVPLTALACTLSLIGTALSPIIPGWCDATLVVARIWSRTMLAIAGARVEYSGLEHVHDRQPRLYVANHQSHIDVWALLAVVPRTTRFGAKAELFDLPLMGWALRKAGFIRIDRRDRASAIDSLKLAAEDIRGGRSMLLYAEGTRTRDGRLQPFKKGAFHLALAADVPLVPTAVSGAYDVMPFGTWRVTPGPVSVRFCEPLEIGPYRPNDYQRLLGDVHAIIAAELDHETAESGDAAEALAQRA